MITIQDLEARIRAQLKGKLRPEQAIDESTVLEDLGLSSLQISEIVFELEEDYGVEFDEAKAAEAKTLGDLVALANESLADEPTVAAGGGQ